MDYGRFTVMLRRPVQGQSIELPEACEAAPGTRAVLRVHNDRIAGLACGCPNTARVTHILLARAAVAVEVVLILDFLICVILRTLDTKRTLMHKDDLTKEDELLPTVLSSIMVLISAVIPLAILLYNRRPKPQEIETPREVERS